MKKRRKKKILNYIKNDILYQIQENVDNYIFFSFFKKFSSEEKVEIFIIDIFKNVISKYNKELDELSGQTRNIFNDNEIKEDSNNIENNNIDNNIKEINLIEVKEKIIDLKNIIQQFPKKMKMKKRIK